MTCDAKCSFLHRPKLFSEYHQNLKEFALFCVDLTWNDTFAKTIRTGTETEASRSRA